MTTLDSPIADELHSIRGQVATVLGRLDQLIARTGLDQDADEDDRHRVQGMYRTTAIEWVLQTNRRPMGPAEIGSALASMGRDDRPDLVQVTTYDLWRRGRLAKIAEGLYCHPDHLPPGTTPMTWNG